MIMGRLFTYVLLYSTALLAVSGMAGATGEIRAHAADDPRVQLSDGRWLAVSDETTSAGWASIDGVPLPLRHARRSHSATVMPDGRVLIWGGVDPDGRIVTEGEWFDPSSGTFESAGPIDLIARASHRAVLQVDGNVLMIGGRADGLAQMNGAELWDERTNRSRLLSDIELAQIDISTTTAGAPEAEPFEIASLIASSPRLSAQGVPLDAFIGLQFNVPVSAHEWSNSPPSLIGPRGQEPFELVIAERGRLVFVTPRQELLPASRYTLFFGGTTSEAGVAAGSLTFDTEHVLPAHADARISIGGYDISPDQGATTTPLHSTDTSSGNAKRSSPQIIQQDAHATRARRVAEHFRFTSAKSGDADFWVPDAGNLNGQWRTGRALTAEARNAWALGLSHNTRDAAWRSQKLKSSGTSVSGIIYGISDRPLAGVTVSLGTRATRTDDDGRYLLEGIAEGHQQLVVDGRSVDTTNDDSYGQFVVGVDVTPGKQTPVNPIYLPKVRAQDWIEIESPLSTDITIRTPLMPGFSVHLPKGTVLRDREGNVVRRVAIIPMPLDRVAINYPVNTPLHMTFQPAGLQIEGLKPGVTPGIRFVYPNYSGEEPRRIAEFLNYDPVEKGWYAYGTGRVSDDGLYVVPDAGTEIYRATGFGISFGAPPPPRTPQSCPPAKGEEGNPHGGDPVDLRTGLFLHHTQGPALDDRMPLQIRTTYRPDDSASREFGKGVFHSYSHYLYNAGEPHSNWDRFWLVLPDCSKVPFDRKSAANTVFTSNYQAVADQVPGSWYGAKLTILRSGAGLPEINIMELTRRDGLRLRFNTLGGHLLQMIDRHDYKIEFLRVGGALTRITSPSGRFLDVSASQSTKRIGTITDMGGRVWNYAYDSESRLTRITYPDASFERYVYDANGRMSEVWDRRGNRMVFNQYDHLGRVTHQTLSDGGTHEFVYVTDTDGAISETRVSDPNGSTRRVRFHTSGWMSEDTEALGTALERTTTYERNGLGFLLARVDPHGLRTEFGYDSEWRPTRTTAFAGTSHALTAHVDYNAQHDPVSSTDADGNVATFVWDSRRRLEKIVDHRGREFSYVHDDLDRLASFTDPEQRTTTFGYQLHDLVRITDADGKTARRYVDAMGRTRSIMDAGGRSARLEYDTLDRVIKHVAADGSATSVTYDPMGNLRSLTDAALSTTRWDYDTRQRPIKRTDALNQFETWSYNEAERTVTHVDRRLRTTVHRYDLLGRQSQLTYHDGSTIDFGYDIADRLTHLDDSVSGTMSFAYNLKGQLISETTPTGAVTYGFDARHRLSSVNPSGLAATVYGYDADDRLTSLTQGSEQVGFGYDAQGRRNRLTLPNGVVTHATFGADGRLSALDYRHGGTTLGNIGYGYDDVGQLVERSGTWGGTALPAPTTATATPDANHRLTSFNGSPHTYDDHGNLIDDGARQYHYDIRDRLIEIRQGNALVAAFQYDTFGRRTHKTQNGSTIQYRYDGDNAIAEIEGAQTRSLFTGPGIDERYARDNETGGRSYFLTDALGSTLALTAPNGDVQARYHYSPYGETQFQALAPGFTSGNPYQYTGRENDGAGLYYYRARYYQPTQGRFTQEDPLGFVDGPNPYAYVGGNPLQYRDPLGLWAWGDPLPQWMVDGAAGFGDGMTGGATKWFRNTTGWGSASVNPCRTSYRYSKWAGIITGLTIPIGRAAYVHKVRELPRSGLDARTVVETRNFLKSYFRGRPLNQLLPRLHPRYGYPSLEELLLKNGGDVAQVIARSGGTDFFWSVVMIGGGSIKTAWSTSKEMESNRECECE